MNRDSRKTLAAATAKRSSLAAVSLLAALAVIGVGTSAIGTTHGADRTGAGEPIGGAAPIDAAMVTPAFGWVLTPDRLLTSSDGGTTFRDTHAPLPAGAMTRAAYFSDSRRGFAAAADGNTITVARTQDGGATWTTSHMTDPSAFPGAAYSQLSMGFGDPRHGVLMARLATSPGFSFGTAFVTTDGGASWTARRAPVAGRVSMQPDGKVWLAGGVFGDQLYQSADDAATWNRSQVAPLAGRRLAAVSLPTAEGLPATVLDDDTTEVEILATSDQGHSWHEVSSVPITGKTAMGVRVPVAHTDHGQLVIDTSGGHAYRAATGADVHPTGMPEGAERVTFAPDGRNGWTLAVYGSCLNGKADCTLSHVLVQTVDGGVTWHRLQQWTQALG